MEDDANQGESFERVLNASMADAVYSALSKFLPYANFRELRCSFRTDQGWKEIVDPPRAGAVHTAPSGTEDFTFSCNANGGLAESLKINDLKRLIAAMTVFYTGGEFRLPYSILDLTDLETLYVSVRFDNENKCVVIKVHSQEIECND